MKYITIIYGNKDLWQSFTPDEAVKAIAEVDSLTAGTRSRANSLPPTGWVTSSRPRRCGSATEYRL